MARRSYVITYDIVSDKRRNKVFEFLEGNGDHVQYSVFFCELNKTELAVLKLEIAPLINQKEDQVLIIDMGSAEGAFDTRVEAIGKGYQPPSRITVV